MEPSTTLAAEAELVAEEGKPTSDESRKGRGKKGRKPRAADVEAEPDPEASAGPEESPETEAEDAGGETAGESAGEISEEELVRAVAALVFASPEPLPASRLSQLLNRPKAARLRAALTEVASRLEKSGLPLELREIAGGWLLLTAPEMGPTLARLAETRKVERISAAALETLAVVAYRPPVTKAEIEAIRGVQAGPILRTLVDRGLIHVVGRADQPGHPLQYGTTREFLDRFGLARLEELPRDGELTRD
jgi:segregation and condensation protein B